MVSTRGLIDQGIRVKLGDRVQSGVLSVLLTDTSIFGVILIKIEYLGTLKDYVKPIKQASCVLKRLIILFWFYRK